MISFNGPFFCLRERASSEVEVEQNPTKLLVDVVVSIVVMDVDCYTSDRILIPTDSNSLGKRMNLLPGQPMFCEENWMSVQGADWT